MNEILRRRRALMGQADEQNGLVPGTGYGTGTSVAYVSTDGLLHIDAWGSGTANLIKVPLKKPLTLQVGDVAVFLAVTQTGSLSASFFSYVFSQGRTITIVSNTRWGMQSTYTIATAGTVNELWFQSAQPVTGSNYSCEIRLSINGERVI